MARQKLGTFARIRRKKKAKLEEKKAAAAAAPAPKSAPAPAPDPVKLEAAKKEAAEAVDKTSVLASKGNLVSPVKLQAAQAEAEEKTAVVETMEGRTAVAADPVAAVSDLGVALNVFDWALILLSVAAEELKISKWYAIGGAAVLAALYYVAEKQGWLDFINF